MKHKKHINEILFRTFRKSHHTDTEYRRKVHSSLLKINLSVTNISDLISDLVRDGKSMDEAIKSISVGLRITLNNNKK